MPQDLICRACNYTVSVGWYHYHDIKNGYGARTAFVCAACGVTHYVEHSIEKGTPDRYLYHKSRSLLWKERGVSMPPGEPEISNDVFTGFENFVCPSCKTKGKVLTEDMLKMNPVICCLCGNKMEELVFWVT